MSTFCLGPCGRNLPPSSFRQNGRYRRRWCRDCQAGRPVGSGDDPADLVRRYESLRADCLGRLIRADDPALIDVKRQIRRLVLAVGPVSAAGVRIGWDLERDDVSRAPTKGGRR